jgi:hypothetical protein
MAQYPNSLFVRIADLLYTRLRSLGPMLGTAPSYYIVMENILYDKVLLRVAAERIGNLRPSA